MARNRNLRPVSIWGIEFDALVEEEKTLTATIPTYPVEEGYTVSDTIINEPLAIRLTLYVSNTPVTWLYRHGSSKSRVRSICDEIEEKWQSKELTKIVTTNAIYTNMGITSIAIKHTKETGYAREIAITAQKVRITERRTADIPAGILQSGASGASGGNASTSSASENSSTVNATGSSSGSDGTSEASTRAHSILFGLIGGTSSSSSTGAGSGGRQF